MLTNLATATVMIVFAGGPHTPERTALACELLATRPPPVIIYLTGAEFRGEYSNLAARVRSIAATLPGHPKVITDNCHTTWESCRTLAAANGGVNSYELSVIGGEVKSYELKVIRNTNNEQQITNNSASGSPNNEQPITNNSAGGSPNNKEQITNNCGAAASLLVITSNYHAPRVRWLLSGVLPEFCQMGKDKNFEQKSAKSAKGRELVSAEGGEETTSLYPSVQNSNFPFSASRLTSHASRLTPHASRLTSHASRLTSHASRFTLLTSPDIPWREAFATPRNRQLILGECLSWLYCGPLGLIYRPWLMGLVGVLVAGAVILRSNRKRGK